MLSRYWFLTVPHSPSLQRLVWGQCYYRHIYNTSVPQLSVDVRLQLDSGSQPSYLSKRVRDLLVYWSQPGSNNSPSQQGIDTGSSPGLSQCQGGCDIEMVFLIITVIVFGTCDMWASSQPAYISVCRWESTPGDAGPGRRGWWCVEFRGGHAHRQWPSRVKLTSKMLWNFACKILQFILHEDEIAK